MYVFFMVSKILFLSEIVAQWINKFVLLFPPPFRAVLVVSKPRAVVVNKLDSKGEN